MNEMDLTLPPELETALHDFYVAPQPDSAFAARLELSLRRRHRDLTLPSAPPRQKTAYLQILRAKPALMILLALLALALLSSAAYALGRLTGYIPGFGFTGDTDSTLTLAEPAEILSDGVTLRVLQATGDSQRFSVTLEQLGQPQSNSEHLYPSAALFTPDGDEIEFRESDASPHEFGLPGQTVTFQFAPLPPGTSEVLLRYEIIAFSEENQNNVLWQAELTLRLRPLRANEIIPPPIPEGWQPLFSESQGGLRLALENVATASDKTILQVALHFDQPGVSLIGDWHVNLTGADGALYPLTLVTSDANNRIKTYETAPFPGSEILTLTLTAFPDPHTLNFFVDYSDRSPAFTFDPGPNPSLGQTWALDELVQTDEFTLRVLQAELSTPNTLTFTLQAEPGVTGVMLRSESASGAENSLSPDSHGRLQTTLSFTSLPNQPFEIHLMWVYYTVQGVWQITWQGPAAPSGLQVGSPATPPPTLGVFMPPTPAFSDPLWLELTRLSESFDAPFQQGPGWIHTVTATETNPRPGQSFPPPYITSEEWLEIDEQGYVIRAVHTDRDASGQVIQQSLTAGDRYINFTLGESGYLNGQRYRFTSGFLLQDFNAALESNAQVSIEETPCEQAPTCYLITMFEAYDSSVQNPGEPQAFSGLLRQTWVDKASGQTLKMRALRRLQDGTEKVDYTITWLTLEKLPAPPPEIHNLLEKVVWP